ncbi:MAG: ClC family H(+)/Cl(-) exchange transporter [Clostridiales Family XIII bacterium]|jgi:H+/Cl- antiporter ClcA|nr:ClC family H(+)/Cl(-) exchange transporter [Clostridiales Family XIII bacterium]
MRGGIRISHEKTPILLKSALIGVVAGGFSTLYRMLLSAAETLCFTIYDFVRGHLVYLPVLLAGLALAGLVLGWAVKRFPLISGSGIPQVKAILAGYLKDRWYTTLLCKFAGGALAILSGLSLGREGPSIQIGACVADGIGRRISRSQTERKVLIAGGASAGLAAAFNAPLAGVLFAFEEIFQYLSPVMLLATSISAVASDYVSRLILGTAPIFRMPLEETLPLSAYWTLLVLGGFLGLAGALYNFTLISVSREYKKRFKARPLLRPVPIFLLTVIPGLCFPYILCGGHAALTKLSVETGLLFLLALLVLKFLFSVVSFASGVPGGIFFPLLIIGALLGGVFAKIAALLPGVDNELFLNFVILSMAGFFAAVVRAPITGVVLLSEMTGSLTHMLSLALVSIIAYAVADAMRSTPVYISLMEDLVPEATKGKGAKGLILFEELHRFFDKD